MVPGAVSSIVGGKTRRLLENWPLENYLGRKHNSYAPDSKATQKGYAATTSNGQ